MRGRSSGVAGVQELQKSGVLECWSVGVLGYWGVGRLEPPANGERRTANGERRNGERRTVNALPQCFLSAGGNDHSDDDQPGDHEANSGAHSEGVEHGEQQDEE
jgi:hypothetical protein